MSYNVLPVAATLNVESILTQRQSGCVGVGVKVGVGESQLIPSEQIPKLIVLSVVEGSVIGVAKVPSHAQILNGMLGVAFI